MSLVRRSLFGSTLVDKSEFWKWFCFDILFAELDFQIESIRIRRVIFIESYILHRYVIWLSYKSWPLCSQYINQIPATISVRKLSLFSTKILRFVTNVVIFLIDYFWYKKIKVETERANGSDKINTSQQLWFCSKISWHSTGQVNTSDTKNNVRNQVHFHGNLYKKKYPKRRATDPDVRD